MSTPTYEELVALFGKEVADDMTKQAGGSGGGIQVPYPRIQKVASHGSPLGKFEDYVVGVEYEKVGDERQLKDTGTNLGTDFEVVFVKVQYQYKQWDPMKKITHRSTITDATNNLDSLVDSYTGAPLPKGKEAKKAANWKFTRIDTVLLRKSKKDPWTPAIFTTDGTLLFSLGEFLDKAPNKGMLTGIAHLKFKLGHQGSTQFSVLDTEKSTFTPVAIGDLFKDEDVRVMARGITASMNTYAEEVNARANASSAAQPSAAPQDSADDVEW